MRAMFIGEEAKMNFRSIGQNMNGKYLNSWTI